MNFCIRPCYRFRNKVGEVKNSFKLLSRKINYSVSKSPENRPKAKNVLFSTEKKRQLESVGRLEKITVKVICPGEDSVFHMNKDISTPLDCARHVSQKALLFSPLSLIDSDKLWEMHRPLTSNCTLKFLYFDDEDPRILHNIFWESCSFMLGAVIQSSFKDNVKVLLHSYPKPDYTTGSFVYDAQLCLDNWNPKLEELRVLTQEMTIIKGNNLNFERLMVNEELAMEIMGDNDFKLDQVKRVASQNQGFVTLYRIGDHIDISEGPLMSNTSLVNMVEITAVHKLESDIENLYRFQGVALPAPIMLNYFAFSILSKRASELNPQPIPQSNDSLMSLIKK